MNKETALIENLEELRAAIAAEQDRLGRHPVFAELRTLDALRAFTEWHVFAVWDFLSLLKRLQRDLTCVTMPWMPPANPRAARLINEIVLGEESDLTPDGSALSHFELYRAAMREIGADTGCIDAFLDCLNQGVALEAAVARAGVPAPAAAFLRSTLRTAQQGSLEQVLGSFFHGRENVIPRMFAGLLKNWGVTRAEAPLFVFYLDRHIAVDSDTHGPAGAALIAELVDQDPIRQEALLSAALAALKQREQLWDGLLSHLSVEAAAAQ
jgi:hypothetical protein